MSYRPAVATVASIPTPLRLTELHTAWVAAERLRRESPEARAAAERASAEWSAARSAAVRSFAQGRGWRLSRQPFALSGLATRRCIRSWQATGGPFDLRAFDHASHFTVGRRPAGVVVHVYADDYTHCHALAADLGVAFEPLPFSWYYPGACLAGVYLPRVTP